MSAAQKSLVKCEPPQLDSKKKLSTRPAGLSAANAVTEDILDAVLPPKVYNQDGKSWQIRISSTPATKIDVVSLGESLDMRLQQRQARETGICPVREELYGQCFDEIIRQVTVGCAERGALLLRIRDEIRMTVAAYQTLYESSVAFGMRKALMAEQRKNELRAKVKLVSAEVRELERAAESLQSRCENLEASEKERYATEEDRHAAEVEKLKSMNEDLKEQLEGLLAVKK